MYEMYKEIEEENKGYVVLVLNGIFYVALGSLSNNIKEYLQVKTNMF